MKYKILTKDTIQQLEKEVNKLLKAGWIPQGGISIVEHQPIGNLYKGLFYSQALIKMEIVEKD